MVGGRQGAPGFDRHRLRAAREAARLTRTALAHAAQMHPSSIRAWEAGRQIPRVESVATLARALNIDSAELLQQPPDGAALTLLQLRVAAGQSQQQIAETAGMLRNTYSAVERGETATLSYGDVKGLARAFGVNPEVVVSAHGASRAARVAQRPRSQGRS